MRARTGLWLASLMLALITSAVAGTWTVIDVPGATVTQAIGINDAGKIVGDYVDSADATHGFLLDSGTYTTIEPAGSLFSFASAINSSDTICGFFQDNDGYHGFVYNGVTYTTLDYPGGRNTLALDINNAGEVVGTFLDGATYRGFKWSAGTFTAINVPGALYTMVNGNDNRGHIVGSYSPSNQKVKNFIMNANHAIRVVGGPVGLSRTNDNYILVGTVGFDGTRFNLRTQHLTKIHYSNSFATFFSDINNHGQIVGYYQDTPSSNFHGILRTP